MIVERTINGRTIIIGKIHNKVFSKTVKKSFHLFRKFDSWGVDYDSFVNYVMPNCTIVSIKDVEEGIGYLTSISNYGKIENGKYVKSNKVEIRHYKGYGAQIFLPRRYFMTTKETLSMEKIKERLGVK